MKDIRFGIIGFGGAGRAHARRLKRIKGVRVTHVFDPKLNKIHAVQEEQYRDIRFTDDLSSFMDSGIQAASICSPDHTHFLYASQTVGKGMHTLVEKPMFTSMEDCERMARLLDGKNLVFGVHHQKRFIPAFSICRDYVREGRLGEILAIEVDYVHYIKVRATMFDDWRLDPDRPQNIVLGAMCHSFDLINWITGEEPRTVFSISGHRGWKEYPDVDTNMTVLEYSSGMTAKAYSSFASGGPQRERIVIYGTKGQIHNNVFTSLKDSSRITVHPETMLTNKQRVASHLLQFNNIQEYPYSVNEHSKASTALMAEFVECIRKGTPFSVDFDWGTKSIELCSSAIKSYQSGRPVHLKKH